MKKKEFASLARQLLPHFSGMVVHIPLMLLRPVKPVLRGICFEGSGSDPKSFYVWKFWLPLYVPRKRISFTHGERLRDEAGAEMWNVTESRLVERLTDAIRTQALPFLEGLDTPQSVVERARQAAAGSEYLYFHQTFSFALAKAGRYHEAAKAIEVFMGLLDRAVPWQAELGAQADALKQALVSRPDEVPGMLDSWMTETIRHLGLEALC